MPVKLTGTNETTLAVIEDLWAREEIQDGCRVLLDQGEDWAVLEPARLVLRRLSSS